MRRNPLITQIAKFSVFAVTLLYVMDLVAAENTGPEAIIQNSEVMNSLFDLCKTRLPLMSWALCASLFPAEQFSPPRVPATDQPDVDVNNKLLCDRILGDAGLVLSDKTCGDVNNLVVCKYDFFKSHVNWWIPRSGGLPDLAHGDDLHLDYSCTQGGKHIAGRKIVDQAAPLEGIPRLKEGHKKWLDELEGAAKEGYCLGMRS